MSKNAEIDLRNCSFRFKCTQTWDGSLRPIPGSDPDKRLCVECRQLVHLVRDNEGLKEALRNNWCVAIPTVLLEPAAVIRGEDDDEEWVTMSVGHPRIPDQVPVKEEIPCDTDPFAGADEALREISRLFAHGLVQVDRHFAAPEAVRLAIETFGKGWAFRNSPKEADRIVRERLHLMFMDVAPANHPDSETAWRVFLITARSMPLRRQSRFAG